MTYSDSMEIIALKRELRVERERRIVAEATAEANGIDFQRLREKLEAHHRVGYGLEWGEKCEICST